MLKVWFACAVLLLSAGAAFYATEGKLWGLPQHLGIDPSALLKTAPPEKAAEPKNKKGEGAERSAGRQGVAVEATTAVSTSSTEDLRAIGTLQSDESVQISSEITGRITEIPLGEGSHVNAGDVMVRLDDALAVAELDDAQARYNLAQGNLGRANSLAKSGNVTERARDEASTNAETARAALELAKVRLAKHTIRAPFSGVAGIRKVSPGAYIAAGAPIVNLEKIDTLKIDFKLPELYLSQVKTGQTIEISVDALPGRTFTGTIYAIDPHLDVNGRALNIRARLENPELILRPGLFARVRVKGQVKRNVLVVPESAIVPRGEEKIVFRVENGQALEAKVTLGSRNNGLVEILEGLAVDATVVTAGQQKLKDGSQVEIVTGSQPTARGT
ncbi:MAG: efflux RND transporter periplasmic adaptor subunit [Hyphomicrobium zavarzinii]|jgi:membrane fusion protein (multidrug efflux system)|uniref:efflux RND transporter periplasmic adaptor subunit n=1 Tax=Hyphomicrobium TaxID=81 RepID=UPI00035E84C8|nr:MULTISPECIES: efflux RND transporter periplasmic adaptor subunit [Hyphomicrobium]MBL8845362.1 efflux RND transporter periplasmic adaptor subunit [Hyphomicrobium zavarzinii]WBT40226.1 efflux RND transporter periplasmic adaptor subunit [Hyphomicrobium sp. DMF-1]HML44136.1 efflux RND transporter periplasmic adaptor subunit [Hyphomicrobium zavarzinii]